MRSSEVIVRDINHSIYQTIKFMTIEKLEIYLDYRVDNLYKENMIIDLSSFKTFFYSPRRKRKKKIYTDILDAVIQR